MSAKARGITDKDLAGKPTEFAMPDVLVQIAANADVALTYLLSVERGFAGDGDCRAAVAI